MLRSASINSIFRFPEAQDWQRDGMPHVCSEVEERREPDVVLRMRKEKDLWISILFWYSV